MPYFNVRKVFSKLQKSTRTFEKTDPKELEYQIFIVNQVGEDPFNRAKLLNVGFMEALKLYDWQCFVFHDVDLGQYS